VRQDVWSKVDQYFSGLYARNDDILEAVLQNCAHAGLPSHNVSPCQGKFLQLVAKIQGSRRILEVGTLGGYSAIWLGRALGDGGAVVTIEASEMHAAVAAHNIAMCGMQDRISLVNDDAARALQRFIDERVAPFDLIFIDADKPNNPTYLRLALQLSRQGTIIIGDNVVRQGEAVNDRSLDPKVQGVRIFCKQLARDATLSTTAIQTVGMKGYDGFTLSIVESARGDLHTIATATNIAAPSYGASCCKFLPK